MSRKPYLSRRWLDTAAGLLVCAVAALLASVLFSFRGSNLIIPFGFLAVLLVVAKRCGAIVGMIGSVIAALIFAYRLYPPVHSLAVDSQSARANLAWMVLAGVVLSYLFASPQEPKPHK
jgi:K+-sensing histidine kinase KdpD